MSNASTNQHDHETDFDVFGDTITVSYVISEIDEPRRRTLASIEVRNQRGELVAVAKHITKWTENVSVRPAA